MELSSTAKTAVIIFLVLSTFGGGIAIAAPPGPKLLAGLVIFAVSVVALVITSIIGVQK